MAHTTLFRLGLDGRTNWLSSSGKFELGSLNDLAAASSSTRLIFIAPATSVTLGYADIPSRNRNTLLRALPFALEEQLAADPESLQFVPGRADENGVPVAVAAKNLLSEWTQNFAMAGLKVSEILPAPLLLPLEEQSISVLIDTDGAIVRTGVHSGFGCDAQSLPELMPMLLADEACADIERIVFFGEGPWAEFAGIEIDYQPLRESPLAIMKGQLADAHTFNLLTGSFGSSGKSARLLKPWRFAAGVAALWLILAAGSQWLDYRQLQQEQTAIRAQMESVFRDAVPEVSRLVNPKVQLQSRLAELGQGSASQDGFLELLQAGSLALAENKNITMQNLRYRDGRLELSLTGASLEALDALEKRFNEQPRLAAVMRTLKRNDTIESRVTLRLKAP